jgi:hypothetical protein
MLLQAASVPVEVDVWKQEIFSRLDALAEGLQTTTGQLYEVMLHGAFVEGLYASMIVFTALVCICVCGWAIKYVWQDPDTKDGDTGGIISVICIPTVICVLVMFCWLNDAIFGLVAPDYWVLRTILDTLTSQ